MDTMLEKAVETLMVASIALGRAARNIDLLYRYTETLEPITFFTAWVSESRTAIVAIAKNVDRALMRLNKGSLELADKELANAMARIVAVKQLFIEEILPSIIDLQVPDAVKTELFLEAEDILRNLEKADELIRRALWMIFMSIQQRQRDRSS